MISAVDDAVGSIMNEVNRSGAADNTLTFFTSDNGPSRESRNWLDGRSDPYYGGTAGAFKGHKFSLFEGGVREPAIVNWPGVIPAGQVIDDPIASMDILPSALEAAGVDASALELDGQSILPVVARNETPEERTIFWEMNGQTAMRRGDWKLVLNGQLVEEAEPIAEVHLSNIIDDPGEANNLADVMPELAAELKVLAEVWRADIEERWQREYAGLEQNVQTHAMI
jgi:arylsulfatase A-like enzyme